MNSRRSRLVTLNGEIFKGKERHAGLWLDKYIVSQERDDPENRSGLVADVASFSTPSAYVAFYKQWEKTLKSAKAEIRYAVVQGRMIVGLGSESVLETSIALHRTYGVPYIPGSALKGLTASYARQHLDAWSAKREAYKVVFGDTDDAGYITFFDALYVPDSGHNKLPLHSDVITVHHEDYYQEKKGSAPTDKDNPNPIPFLSATGKYIIALTAPDLDDKTWLTRTFDILELALKTYGIGAKTSSGYGRMTLETPPVDPEIGQAERYKLEIERMQGKYVSSQLSGYYPKWLKLTNYEARQIVAAAIVEKVRKAGREKASADKSWYKDLLAFLGEG